LVRRSVDDSDESIASFVRRRLGHEVLDYAVDPFISGIFAGDVETLSMAHAFPRVYALEREYGSLSKGLMAQRSAARKQASGTSANGGATDAGTPAALESQPDAGAPVRPRLISFIDGMQTLTDALEAALAGTLRLGCPVRLLHRDEARWIVDAGQEGAERSRAFDAVVMATPRPCARRHGAPGRYASACDAGRTG
jgi:oxygen-dependent protoporphyrinogen oxidase